jgi:hypothetical protein
MATQASHYASLLPSTVLATPPLLPIPLSLSLSRSLSPIPPSDSDDGDIIEEEDNGLYKLPLPPEGIYPSREAAKEAANVFSERHGYSLVWAQKAEKAKGAPYPHRYYLECKRHKDRQSKKARPRKGVRNKATFRKQCKMKLSVEVEGCGRKKRPTITDDSQWLLLHKAESNHYHNHPPDIASMLSDARRTRARRHGPVAARQRRNGGTRAQITSNLRDEFPEDASFLLPKDISNLEAQKAKADLIEIGSITTQLFKELDDQKFIHFERCNDETGRLEYLCIIDPILFEFVKKSPSVLHFDCTYSTNKYNLPLLDFCIMTGQNTTISFGFAILMGEAEDNFIEALGGLKSLYDE